MSRLELAIREVESLLTYEDRAEQDYLSKVRLALSSHDIVALESLAEDYPVSSRDVSILQIIMNLTILIQAHLSEMRNVYLVD